MNSDFKAFALVCFPHYKLATLHRGSSHFALNTPMFSIKSDLALQILKVLMKKKTSERGKEVRAPASDLSKSGWPFPLSV